MILEILSMDSKTFINKHLFIWGINIAHHHKYQVNSVVLVNFKEKKKLSVNHRGRHFLINH